jgi:hypothetical protein
MPMLTLHLSAVERTKACRIRHPTWLKPGLLRETDSSSADRNGTSNAFEMLA